MKLSGGFTSYGGNRDVQPPWITYEFKTNPYDEAVGSYVPYITVLKEGLDYNYYSVGAEDPKDYGEEGKYSSENNLGADGSQANGGVYIGEENISDINLLEAHYGLNMINMYLPFSAESTKKKLKNNPSAVNPSDKGNWLEADAEFPPELVYTTQYESVVYKMPLQRLVDRYLPKASLLTAWYLVKDNDVAPDKDIGKEKDKLTDTVFNVDELMTDIKNIYNKYCWSEENISREQVDAVQYDKDGNVIRDEKTGKAEMKNVELPYTAKGSNEQTFIHFGQAGIEANLFHVFVPYSGKNIKPGGPKAPEYITGDSEETTIPVVTNFLAEDAYFLDEFSVEIYYEAEEVEIVNSFVRTLSSGEPLNEDGLSELQEYKELALRYLRKNSEGYYYLPINTVVPTKVSHKVKELEGKKIIGQSIYKKSTKTSTNKKTVVIPYSSGDATTSGTLSNIILQECIKLAETELMKDPIAIEANKRHQEAQEEQIINYEYIFAPDEKEQRNGKWYAQPLFDIEKYDQTIPFYNFGIGNREHVDYFIGLYNELILAAFENAAKSGGKLPEKILEYVKSDVEKEETLLPETIKVIGYSGGNPKYSNNIPLFDIQEEKINLTMDVPQKRISVMLVIDVQSWAKEATYTNDITNNHFYHDNYRYVIPHSYFGFGVRVFQITENPLFRTNTYEKYFSDPEDTEPAIKEADIINMLLKWEEYADGGNVTAYNFMRDLYKLVLYIRDSGGVLSTAYSYLYMPETIWGFDEGVTQEAYWTERLAAGIHSQDPLTEEEQEKFITKKNEIYWQIVDYRNYEECQDGDITRVYALFPFGSAYTRAYYMEEALRKRRIS